MRSPVDYHALAADLVEYACGGAHGRSENDPVYQAVTEGRDAGAIQRRYSSCGDLAHWLLYRLGVRLPFVNRREHRGWTSGVNVSRLAFERIAEVDPGRRERFLPGDIGIVWSKADATDAHVLVILEDAQPDALLVGEYGQPGGHVRARAVSYDGDMIRIGARCLHRVLRLARVIDIADEAGALLPPEPTEYWARRLGLAYPRDTEPAPPAPEAA
jgi:hypothetical protein